MYIIVHVHCVVFCTCTLCCILYMMQECLFVYLQDDNLVMNYEISFVEMLVLCKITGNFLHKLSGQPS